MDIITVQKLNEVWMHVKCDAGIRYELSDHFRFQVPGYKFTPQYKVGRWDGYISLFSPVKGTMHIGLISDLNSFCKSRGYELQIAKSDYGSPEDADDVSFDEIKAYVDSLDVHSRGQKLTPNDYQYNAIFEAIRNHRRVVLSPTGSGKSLIIYALSRFVIDCDEATLIICPTTSLVEQMVSDFEDYSSNNDFEVEANVHKIYAGQAKTTKKKIVVSTWQSLMRMPPEWFSRFGCVICDEVHQGKSKEISTILEKCVNSKRRYGLTGSLDKSQTHKMMIQALFGPIIRVATTKELIDKGHLSDISITSIVLDYSKDTKKLLGGVDYQTEVDFLVGHEKRNKFIRNLALSLKGNTLILYNYVEKHGDKLHQLLIDKESDKKIFYVHGGVDVEDRESIRQIAEQQDDVIILASFGTFSTGINIKRLHNVIFASPTKSVIRVLQSVGRGLRKSSGKDRMKLYDIGDKLSNSKKRPNYTFKHFAERLGIYVNEEFDYKIVEVVLEK